VGFEIRRQEGFTLIEVLVAITILAVVGTTFISLMVSTTRSAQDAKDVVRVSEEARLGFTRMVRDTREATKVTDAPAVVGAPATHYKIAVDFDANGTIAADGTKNPQGDYEVLEFSFTDGDGDGIGTIRLNGEALIRRVTCVEESGVCLSKFDFRSNRLEYDWNSDGVVTWKELDEAAPGPPHSVIGVGNNNGRLDGNELSRISDVVLRFRVTSNDMASNFFAEAQLRNVR
jgi:prepilin-type N-terminal cleavage/methylation domain-containing protein